MFRYISRQGLSKTVTELFALSFKPRLIGFLARRASRNFEKTVHNVQRQMKAVIRNNKIKEYFNRTGPFKMFIHS